MLLNNKGEYYMKTIRFTLHYLVQAFYKLWQFLWAPILVTSAWCTVGYLLSRITIFRDLFDKGTSDWFVIVLSPVVIVSIIELIIFIPAVILLIGAFLWDITLSVRKYQPIKKLKDNYKNFK